MNKALGAVLLISFASAAFPLDAQADAERVDVCAHYAVNYGWSDGHKVQATLTSGSDLNRATSSFNYNAFSKYVVIFWDQGQASVIELDSPWLTYFDTEGKDQQGRAWKVAKTSGLCF